MPADLTGRRFGKLEIIGPAGDDYPQVISGWWLARCACGREMIAPAEAYLSRRLTSCGRPTPQDRAELAEQLGAMQLPPRL
jgi:hypothetical protein